MGYLIRSEAALDVYGRRRKELAYDRYEQPGSSARSSGRIIPSSFPIGKFRENRTATRKMNGQEIT